jgi:hypothetical protein
MKKPRAEVYERAIEKFDRHPHGYLVCYALFDVQLSFYTIEHYFFEHLYNPKNGRSLWFGRKCAENNIKRIAALKRAARLSRSTGKNSLVMKWLRIQR